MVYQYAILRFMPYIETSEFANVGIVMAAPRSSFFAYRLQEKYYTRLIHFFKNLDGRTYTVAIQAMKEELNRIQLLIHTQPNTSDRLFEELIRPRETLFVVECIEHPSRLQNNTYKHALDLLKKTEAKVISVSEKEAVIDFAGA
jgi:hypothetical protein